MADLNLDFSKICRVCLNEGIMMPIFKVNVSKKMMACASVQVWQNDGLPAQICNKCSAKLHISFQFKKQCEKSDARLRQHLQNLSQENLHQQHHEQVHHQQQQQQQEHQQPQQQQTQNQALHVEHQIQSLEPANQINLNKMNHITTVGGGQVLQQPTQNECVFIECAPIIEMTAQEQKYDSFIPVSQSQQQQTPLTQINYNIQPQNHLQQGLQIGGYSIQNVNQVQVYNGAYSMPLQPMQTSNILHNNIINSQVQINTQPIPPQQQLPHLQPIIHAQIQDTSQSVGVEEKDKMKKVKPRRDSKGGNSEEVKQCPTCNKVFSTGPKLSRHMKTHSSDMPYKCKVCNKPFSHSGNYKIHLRMHTDERPFRCTVCNKGCRQAQDLEKHMRTHTGERPHKCTLCTKAFSTSSNLIAHIRTHTGERPYVCCVCQKAFCQSNELTKHMRTHTGEKSHICDICNKGFNGSSTLIVHRRSHTGERPYVCNICNKGFSQSSCLAVHMKRHTGEKNFQCTSCDKSFVTNADLKEHQLTHVDKPFICNMCDKKYTRANDLNKHIKLHTGFSNDPEES